MRDPVIVLFFGVLFWLAMRPVVCWYWHVKEVVKSLESIKQRSIAVSTDNKTILNVLRSIDARLAALQGDAGGVGAEGGDAGKNAAGAGGKPFPKGPGRPLGKRGTASRVAPPETAGETREGTDAGALPEEAKKEGTGAGGSPEAAKAGEEPAE